MNNFTKNTEGVIDNIFNIGDCTLTFNGTSLIVSSGSNTIPIKANYFQIDDISVSVDNGIFKVTSGSITLPIEGEYFKISDNTLNINNNSFSISSGSSYLPIQAANVPSSSSYSYVPTILDVYGTIPLIEFSFDGNEILATGSNLNTFGICYSSGTYYNENDIVFNNNGSYIKSETVKYIVTSTEIRQGNLALDENTLYTYQNGTYTAKGSAGKGTPQFINIPYTYQNEIYTSTASIPATAWIRNSTNLLQEAFNGTGATLQIFISGSTNTTLMNSTVSTLSAINQYEVDDFIKVLDQGQVIVQIVASGSTYGSGSVFIEYLTPRT